ncbi:MAG TPA: AMP-binding protein [Pseudomonadales bacterium]|jgi:crotonobetaine/carnitine-CoA ligase|nr:AMP-binding protein [Pseudomonadales bacterium]
MKTPNVSLIKTLREQAQHTPDRRFVIDVEENELSYGQTIDALQVWASAYHRAGIKHGDHVVTMQLNTIDSMLGWLGLASLGAIEAPINIDYRGSLLTHALNLTRAHTMVLLAQYLDRVLEVQHDLDYLEQIVVLDGDVVTAPPFRIFTRTEFMTDAPAPPELPLPEPWDIMAVLFTSGTTGPSKAVCLPWAQIYAMAGGSYPLADLNETDVLYNPGPTYHVGAKVFPYIAALVGGSHVMRPYISASAIGTDYLKFGVTTGGMATAWLAEPAHDEDTSRPLKNLLSPYKSPYLDAFIKRFGCRQYACFNMTELSCPIVFRDWDALIYDQEERMSCGAIRDGYEARVVDENDQQVPPGSQGELIIRADIPWTLNAGYLNNPDATAEAWRNGWFHTGDAFIVDADGNFYFIDRLKDSIRRRGENISSHDVESYIDSHPEIIQCAAIAVKKSAVPAADEEVKVVVVTTPTSELSAELLIRWLIPRMPRFMIPRYVELVGELPITPTMKVRKAELRSDPINGNTWDREDAGIELPR